MLGNFTQQCLLLVPDKFKFDENEEIQIIKDFLINFRTQNVNTVNILMGYKADYLKFADVLKDFKVIAFFPFKDTTLVEFVKDMMICNKQNWEIKYLDEYYCEDIFLKQMLIANNSLLTTEELYDNAEENLAHLFFDNKLIIDFNKINKFKKMLNKYKSKSKTPHIVVEISKMPKVFMHGKVTKMSDILR